MEELDGGIVYEDWYDISKSQLEFQMLVSGCAKEK